MASESSASDRVSTSNSPPLDSTRTAASTAQKVPHRRSSKACENCRSRRTKCSSESPSCSKCLADGLACSYRQKARPSRKIKGVQLPESTGTGTSQGLLVIGLRAVEQDLEQLYEAKTGSESQVYPRLGARIDHKTIVTIDLRPPPLDVHPLLNPDAPLPPLPSITREEGAALLQIFLDEVHVAFGYLSADRLRQLDVRYQDNPASLGEDQLALLFAVYALGSYRTLCRTQYNGGPPPIDGDSPRPDIAFHRNSAALAERATTVTALLALVTLQFHSVTGTRSLIGKM